MELNTQNVIPWHPSVSKIPLLNTLNVSPISDLPHGHQAPVCVTRGYETRPLAPGSILRTLATTLRHGILKTRGTFILKFLVSDSVLIGQLGFCVFVWANRSLCYSCGNVTLQGSELSMVTTQVQTLTGLPSPHWLPSDKMATVQQMWKCCLSYKIKIVQIQAVIAREICKVSPSSSSLTWQAVITILHCQDRLVIRL